MLAAGNVDPTHTPPASPGYPDRGRRIAGCTAGFPPGSPQPAGTYIKWGPNKVFWYRKAWVPCFHDFTRQIQLSWKFKRPPIRLHIDCAVPALKADDGGPIRIIWDQTLIPPQVFPSFHPSPPAPMEPSKAYSPLQEDYEAPSWHYLAPIFGDCWGKKGEAAAARCAHDPRLIHAPCCQSVLDTEAYRRHQEACQALASLANSLRPERPLSPPKSPTLGPLPSTPSSTPNPNVMPATSAPPSPTLVTTAPSDTIVVQLPDPNPAGPSTHPTKRKRAAAASAVPAASVAHGDNHRPTKKVKKVNLDTEEPRCPVCRCLLYDNGEPAAFSGVGCGYCHNLAPYRGLDAQ